MKMLYEIIKTAKSSDNLICYFLYKQNIDSENISAGFIRSLRRRFIRNFFSKRCFNRS